MHNKRNVLIYILKFLDINARIYLSILVTSYTSFIFVPTIYLWQSKPINASIFVSDCSYVFVYFYQRCKYIFFFCFLSENKSTLTIQCLSYSVLHVHPQDSTIISGTSVLTMLC